MLSEKEKFAMRLQEALDDAGVPKAGQGRKTALAELLNEPPQIVGKWLKGEAFPKTSRLVRLAKYLNVRSNWLLSGTGDKYPSAEEREYTEVKRPKKAKASAAKNAVADVSWSLADTMLSKDAFEVATAWMRLPASQRAALRRVIEELAGADG